MTDPKRRTDEPEAEAGAIDAPAEETAEVTAEPEPEPAAADDGAAEPETEGIAATAVAEPAPSRAARRPRGPRPYAIIETGGKQYRVSVGDTISVERLDGEAGADVTIDRVLLLGGDGTPRVGTPVVAGATVSARIEEQFRGEKITIFKYKPKKRYRRKMGHRQSLTRLEITAINA